MNRLTRALMVVVPPLLLVILAGCASEKTAPSRRTERPNILFIFADDHAAQAVGAYGSRINRTPNIDRLAAEGMLFSNCFVTNSICAPSRAVILTGRHSHLNGVPTNREVFDGAQTTFPKLLREAGYETAMIGKWHLKSDPTGFDHWEVLIGQGPYYNPPMKTPGGVVHHTGYTTDIITDLALDWLERERDPKKPFLLMCQHKAPHRNWQPGPDHLTMYDDVVIPEPATLFDDYEGRASGAKNQEMTIAHHLSPNDLKLVPPRNLTEKQLERWNAAYEEKNAAFRAADLEGDARTRWNYQRYIKDYLRAVASVDHNIGRMLDYLDESELAENTIVIYCSDQGFYLGEHGWYDKRWMYEESLRMPFIVRWPGAVEAGSENAQLVQNLDFAPTFLDAAGVPIPDQMQGHSLLPILFNGRAGGWRDAIYYHYYEFPAVHSVPRHYGIRTDRYKLIHYYQLDEWELFDLHADPNELRSAYAEPAYAALVPQLKARLRRLQTRFGDTNPEAPLLAITQRALRRKAASVPTELVLRLDEADAVERGDLDPSAKPLTVGACCIRNDSSSGAGGVLLAHGGEVYGYSLSLRSGRPCFAVRTGGSLFEIVGEREISADDPVHLAGMLSAEGRLSLFMNGREIASADGALIERKPADALNIGRDEGSHVGSYDGDLPFPGELHDIRLYWGALDPASLRRWAAESLRQTP
ncbi:MAG: sulfatase-like hydrolase/transferase [Planctomycetota bacterium]|nr:sulfatase-like hydrolase/transferase [Planctomycetota bacterium]